MPIRRIVTTNDENGKSRVLIDEPAKQIITVLTEMWLTDSKKVNHTDGIDHASRSNRLEPPPGGTIFRFFQIAPESSLKDLTLEERQEMGRGWFAEMGAAHLQPDTSRHPTMHKTLSTDYIILLRGTITLILDTEERDLRPFDVVIQRGTNHAWVNHGTEDALLMAVLVDDGSAPK